MGRVYGRTGAAGRQPPARVAAVAPCAPSRDAAPIDLDVYEAMRDLVGPERATALLARFAEEIDRRLSAEALLTAKPAALGRDAHALVSSAGALGFLDLARLCGALEAACLSGDVPGALLAEVGAAGSDAIVTIERLRAA